MKNCAHGVDMAAKAHPKTRKLLTAIVILAVNYTDVQRKSRTSRRHELVNTRVGHQRQPPDVDTRPTEATIRKARAEDHHQQTEFRYRRW